MWQSYLNKTTIPRLAFDSQGVNSSARRHQNRYGKGGCIFKHDCLNVK